MEIWQKEHIKANLPELLKVTQCTELFIAHLSAANVLGVTDKDSLSEGPSMRKAATLYEILPARLDSYWVLVKALQSTTQTAAAAILAKSLSFDKNQELGEGSYGTKVCKGIFKGNDVAVKMLNLNIIDPESVQREIQTLRNLRGHPNIVQYFTLETTDNMVYIALELCSFNLEKALKDNRLQVPYKNVLQEISIGLEHLHNNGIIHRDLKPSNILINRQNKVKISDFGISKKIPLRATSVTTSNGVVGTADWMAPEILKQLDENGNCNSPPIRADPSQDIFALGCIFYFVLTKGKHPYGSVFDRTSNIQNNRPQLNDSVGDVNLLNMVKRMLSGNAQERPTAAQVVTFLNCSNAGIPPTTPPRPPSPPPQCRPRRYGNRALPTSPKDNSLLQAMQKNKSLDIIKQLVKDGANARVTDPEKGRGGLHFAAYFGDMEKLKYFASQETYVDDQDKNGETPIMLGFGNIKVIEHLMREGESLTTTNDKGNNLAHSIAAYSSDDHFINFVEFARKNNMLDRLFRARNNGGFTPAELRKQNKKSVPDSVANLLP